MRNLERNNYANNILHNVRLDAIESNYEAIISTSHYMTYKTKNNFQKYILRTHHHLALHMPFMY